MEQCMLATWDSLLDERLGARTRGRPFVALIAVGTRPTGSEAGALRQQWNVV